MRRLETASERLTDDGNARLDSAIASYLDQINGAVVMIEGYGQLGTTDEQYRQSRARAATARDTSSAGFISTRSASD